VKKASNAKSVPNRGEKKKSKNRKAEETYPFRKQKITSKILFWEDIESMKQEQNASFSLSF
jgi:hypothetical protein